MITKGNKQNDNETKQFLKQLFQDGLRVISTIYFNV